MFCSAITLIIASLKNYLLGCIKQCFFFFTIDNFRFHLYSRLFWYVNSYKSLFFIHYVKTIWWGREMGEINWKYKNSVSFFLFDRSKSYSLCAIVDLVLSNGSFVGDECRVFLLLLLDRPSGKRGTLPQNEYRSSFCATYHRFEWWLFNEHHWR